MKVFEAIPATWHQSKTLSSVALALLPAGLSLIGGGVASERKSLLLLGVGTLLASLVLFALRWISYKNSEVSVYEKRGIRTL